MTSGALAPGTHYDRNHRHTNSQSHQSAKSYRPNQDVPDWGMGDSNKPAKRQIRNRYKAISAASITYSGQWKGEPLIALAGRGSINACPDWCIE